MLKVVLLNYNLLKYKKLDKMFKNGSNFLLSIMSFHINLQLHRLKKTESLKITIQTTSKSPNDNIGSNERSIKVTTPNKSRDPFLTEFETKSIQFSFGIIIIIII